MNARNVDDFMHLPYTIEVIRDDDEENPGWVARVVELPGCITQGDTFEELGEMIEDAMRGWIEVALEDGIPIPEPRPVEEYSGKFVVRVPRSLHRELVEAAGREGVSLNALCTAFLGEAVGYRRAGKGNKEKSVITHYQETRKNTWARFCLAIGAEEKNEEKYEERVADWLKSEFDSAFQSYLAGDLQEAAANLFHLLKMFANLSADDPILQSYWQLLSQMYRWINVASEQKTSRERLKGQTIDEVVNQVNKGKTIRNPEASRSIEPQFAEKALPESKEVSQFSSMFSRQIEK